MKKIQKQRSSFCLEKYAQVASEDRKKLFVHLYTKLFCFKVGGIEEYHICEAIKSKHITKPLIAWCIGTCASMFTSEVQFGHAGSHADSDKETAVAKNKALREAGAFVPNSFDELGDMIR